MRRSVAETVRRLGVLDILLNDVGIARSGGTRALLQPDRVPDVDVGDAGFPGAARHFSQCAGLRARRLGQRQEAIDRT